MDSGHIAIIGAGMAATTLVWRLRHSRPGLELSVFDKSRGTGGRLATRRSETHEFDHGAPCFTARSPEFEAFVAEHREAGRIEEWQPKVTTLALDRKPFKRPWFEPHYVGTPRMNALCMALLEGESLHTACEIQKVETRDGKHWLVTTDETRHGPFDAVVSTAPAPQAARILQSAADPDFDHVTFDASFALMARVSPKQVPVGWQAAVVHHDVVGWLAFTESKPGRDIEPSLVVHSTPEWARRHLEDEPATLIEPLMAATASLTGIAAEHFSEPDVHRWRFATTRTPLAQPFWLDRHRMIGACGDWCLGSRVEDAFLSASAMARALADH